ncbi:MAG: T9SS type A sorting domain-containing protein [Bacteroidota bacterium]
MKNIYLLLALFFFIGFKSYAQPGGATCAAALANRVVLPFSQSGLSNCGANNISSTNVTTCNASWDYQYLNGDDRMYVFIVPNYVSTISIDFTSSSQNVGLFLYQGCPNTATACTMASTGASGNRSLVSSVVPGQTYYLIVSSNPNATSPTYQCHSNYTLSITPVVNVTPTSQDCLGAINLCQSMGYYSFPSPMGGSTGSFPAELNTGSTCLLSSEVNSTWFKYVAQANTEFSFTITPDVPQDYDYVVIDITNSSCYDIYNSTSQLVDCNYSASNGAIGANGMLGFHPPVSVIANHTYMICANNYSDTPSQVNFDWSTAIPFGSSPTITSVVTPTQCSVNSIDVNFSKAVRCNSFDYTKFVVTDGTSTYTIDTSPGLNSCVPADLAITSKTLTFNTPLTLASTYTLYTYQNAFIDVCGTPNFSTSVLTFTVSGVADPILTSINSPIQCGENSIVVNFAKPIVCDQIDLSKFLLSDGTSTYTINTSAGLNACMPSDLLVTSKTLTFFSPLTDGIYTLYAYPNAFFDFCGNTNLSTNILTFSISSGAVPAVTSINTPIQCGANSFGINFVKPIVCDEIDLSKFLLSDGTSTYTINTSGALNSCTPSNLAITSKTITFNTNLTSLVTYTLQVFPGAIKDECGNGNSTTNILTFTLNPYIFIVNGNTNIYNGFSTSLTATGPGTFTWNNGYVGNTQNYSPAQTTTVSVTGINTGGCSYSVQKTISIIQNSAGNSACNTAENNQVTLPYFETNLNNCGSNVFSATNTFACGNADYLGGDDRLHVFTSSISGFVICSLTTVSTTTNIGLMLYEDCPTNGNCVANSYGNGGTRFLQGEVTAGQTYFLLVSTKPTPNCITSYTLSISEPGAPLLGTPKVDCIAATPVCSNYYYENIAPTNEGLPPFNNEINPNFSCLNTGERKGVWYSINTTSPGSFTFEIDPSNNSDDYDWALFDITNYSCSDIFNNSSLEISCNYSGASGNTGISSILTGQQWESAINLASNRHLMLYISNYTQSTDGYAISLGGSATYTDTEGPTVSGITTPTCGDSTLIVNFTEPVICVEIDPTNFILEGPGGPYTIAQTYISPNCGGASLYTTVSNYTIKFNPPLTTSGVYTFSSISGVQAVQDKCGNSNLTNPSQPSLFTTFTISSLSATASVLSNVNCVGGNDGLATVNVPTSNASYTYLWNSIPAQTTQTASGLSVGTYSVTVTSPNGCSSVAATATITHQNLFTSASVITNAVCFGSNNGSATAVVPSNTITYTYLWSTTPAQSNKVATALVAGTYTVTITHPSGCGTSISTVTITQPPEVPKPAIPVKEFVYCKDFVAPILVATYTGPDVGQIRWYTTRVGGIPSFTAPTPSTNTLGRKTYYVNQTKFGCQSLRDSIIVDVIPNADASITLNENTATANVTNATYQWITCDGNIISGATSQSFQPLTNGSYAVTVTQNACTDTSDCFQVTTVGLSEINKNQNLYIYPNPNNGEFSLELNNITKGIYTIQITNALQQIISHQNIIVEGQNLKQNINLKQSSKGVYFIKINGERFNEIRKVIVE